MKRSLFLCLVLSLLSACLMAQGVTDPSALAGIWRSENSMNEKADSDTLDVAADMTSKDVITLGKDGKFSRTTEINFNISGREKQTEEKEKIDVKMLIKGSVTGTWTVESGHLVLAPSKNAKPEISAEVEGVPGIVRGLFLSSIKKKLKSAMKEVDEDEIVSFTGDELVLKDLPDPKESKKNSSETPKEFKYKRVK